MSDAVESDFEDLRIVDLDLSKTTWSRVHDSLRVMFLRLDRPPPDTDWPRLFFEERETRIVARRRGLWIEDDYISFDTLPEEVETVHLPDIRLSIAYANRCYRALDLQRRRDREAKMADQRSERDGLLALQARVRLLFDGEATVATTTNPADATPPAAVKPAEPAPASPQVPTVATAPDDPFAEFELRRNALKQAFRAAASQDKEQK